MFLRAGKRLLNVMHVIRTWDAGEGKLEISCTNSAPIILKPEEAAIFLDDLWNFENSISDALRKAVAR